MSASCVPLRPWHRAYAVKSLRPVRNGGRLPAKRKGKSTAFPRERPAASRIAGFAWPRILREHAVTRASPRLELGGEGLKGNVRFGDAAMRRVLSRLHPFGAYKLRVGRSAPP